MSSPSSHGSSPSATPSPQTVSRHTSPGASQTYPDSRRQVLEQPSSASVLPSSQLSRPAITPSPQIGWQRSPAPSQRHPLSSWHSSSQPSSEFELPSSHVSAPE